MAGLHCALCSLTQDEVGSLVVNDRDQGVCDACLLDGCALLLDPSRLYVRRQLLERAASAGEVDAARLQSLIAALPADPVASYLPAGHDGQACVLCGGWGSGWQGVSSPGGSICGACLALSLTELVDGSWRALHFALLTFDERARNSETEPVLWAMLGLSTTPDDLRALHDSAARVQNTHVCRAALERIPAGDRTEVDLFSLAAHYAELGDARRAIELHRAIRDSVVARCAHSRGVWLMNEVSFALDSGETTPADLRRWAAQLDEVHTLLERGTEPDRRAYVPMAYQLLASVRLLEGLAGEAEAALDAADRVAPTSADRWELRGRALAARGDPEGAAAAFGRALAQVHPDRRLAARIREQLRGSGAI